MAIYAGVDLGGTNIAIGIVNEEGAILARTRVKTAMPRGSEAIMEDIAGGVKTAVGLLGKAVSDLSGVGVGVPGVANGSTGVVEYACNLSFCNVPMVRFLEASLGVPVRIENDANAAAYGEYVAGAAKGLQSVVMVTIGTGVGGGIILNGKIYTGFGYAGGELGHMVIDPAGPLCNCGRRGCLEQFTSIKALVRMTKEEMDHSKESLLWQVAAEAGKVDGRTVFRAKERGDAAAERVFARYIGYLGLGLTNLINILQPELVCIGGGISKEGDGLVIPLAEYIDTYRYARGSGKTTQLCAAALGNDAGIIGAALLSRQFLE